MVDLLTNVDVEERCLHSHSRKLHRQSRLSCLLLSVFTIVCSHALADEPGAAYIFPAGGRQGTTVEVRVGGLCLHEQCDWQMLGEGVTAGAATKTETGWLARQVHALIPHSPSTKLRRIETIWFEGPQLTASAAQQAENYPKDYAGSVTIAADAPLGTRFWRVWNSQGATPGMKFIVGELPEVVEAEQDGEAIPVEVALPVTINGRIFPREDVDLWSFTAAQGQTVRVEVSAARIGSQLQTQLEVLDPRGKLVATRAETIAGDPALTFTASEAGSYQVRIHDVGYGGLQNHVYRLTISSQPYITGVFPLGGRRGSKLDVSLTGSNLAAASGQVELNATGSEQLVRFEQAGQKSNPVMLEVDDLVELTEQEPNDQAAQAQTITDSAVCNGRIQAAGDVDVWTFDAKKGETLDIEVRASRRGSPLDAVLTIVGADGKELAAADDISPENSDAQLRFAAPADGVYALAISERTPTRGGLAFAYRLRIDRARPADFRLWVSTDALTLYRGAEARLKVDVQRLGGFTGPIELSFANLPTGVTVSGNKINENAAQADIVLKADAAAPIRAVQRKLHGTAQIAGAAQVRTASQRVARGEMRLESILLAVSLPTPFKVVGTFELRYAPRGSVQQRHYRLERGGYDGPLEVRLADRQMRYLQGVTGPSIVVPAGADEFDYPITLPPDMELGRTSRSVVTATATIGDSQDGQHVVSFTSQNQNEQIVLLVSPGALSLHLEPAVLVAEPGREFEVQVILKRDGVSAAPVKVELVVPRHITGISAEPVEIAADQTRATLKLRCDKTLGPLNMPLTVRASTTTGPAATAAANLEVIAAGR